MSYFSIDKIRNVHLFGIDLKDAEGNDFPDELLQSYLDSAIAEVEKKLNIYIHPRDLVERHDYHWNDYQNWGYIKLFKKPVLEIESIQMYYGDYPMYKIPKDWLRVDQLTGQIQLFPTSGSAGGLIIDARGSLFTPLVQGRFGYAPQMWEVKYKAGMTEPTEEAKKNQMYRKTDITPDLEELIYKKAAASIMTVWGDLIIGAGIANQSISVDGLSQSVGTTQSAMYGGASARVKQLEQDVKRLMTELYNYYNGPTLFAI